MYMIWYGAGRFVIEGLRTDSLTIGTLRVSQALSALLCVGSLIVLLVMLSKVKRMGREYKLYVDTAESKALLAETEQKIAEAAAKKAAKKAGTSEDTPAAPILAEEETEDEPSSERTSPTQE